ncbi:unnamed protein product [Caenorhabditis auriculariae]|uniref:Uncharacterized protein n=1 Tax=Caenorhabditis auriculariae TaxID=2777116 RepID=A0A8S1HIX0_9PELO|nr:unnamed protein product [Caenorhabditis auriculariae]
MANVVMVVQKPADSKWCGVYPPKIGLYVYLFVGLLLTIASFTQGYVIMPSLMVLMTLVEVYAIYRDHACLLLFFLIMNTISVVILCGFSVFAFLLLFVLTGVASVKRGDQKGDVSPFEVTGPLLVLQLLLLAMVIHQWLLTLWVYRHASNKKKFIAYTAAPAVGQVVVETA